MNHTSQSQVRSLSWSWYIYLFTLPWPFTGGLQDTFPRFILRVPCGCKLRLIRWNSLLWEATCMILARLLFDYWSWVILDVKDGYFSLFTYNFFLGPKRSLICSPQNLLSNLIERWFSIISMTLLYAFRKRRTIGRSEGNKQKMMERSHRLVLGESAGYQTLDRSFTTHPIHPPRHLFMGLALKQ